MQKLYIKHLGPIEECEINIDEFMVCTGPQASGKSTIAKSIFFFKNIIQGIIINKVPVFICFDKFRISPVFVTDERHQAVWAFAVILRLCKNNDIAVIPHLFKLTDRNGISHPAI